MIKWILFILLGSNVILTTSDANLYSLIKVDDYNSSNIAFQSGEKLTYKIYYNWGVIWLAAGEVVFTVEESEKYYIYKAIGKSYSSYSWIFEVDDYFYSFVDKETLLPIRAKRDINEGGYIIHNDIQFDQKNKTAVSTIKINNKKPKTVTKQFDSSMYDILSVIYSLRNTEKSSLNVGEEIAFTMMLDGDVYPLSMEYLGKNRRTKVKKLGKYNTIKISPSVIKGRVFAKDERMNVWISDDNNNLPLIIESPLAVGKIKVVLQKYERLKYTLEKCD